MRDRVCGTIGAVGVLVLAGCKSIPSRAAPVAAESAVSANQAAPHDHLRFGRAAYEEFATDAQSTALIDICSRELTTVSPDDQVGTAVRLMRENAIRRLPVVARGRPVGIVTLGDLALEQDRGSALADVSAAPPNL